MNSVSRLEPEGNHHEEVAVHARAREEVEVPVKLSEVAGTRGN